MSGDSGHLIEAVEDLVHDLAKYMVFETRFAESMGDAEHLREALQADLCATRKTRDGNGRIETESAWEMWRRMLPDQLSQHPLAQEINTSMNLFADVKWDDSAIDVHDLAATAKATSELIRRLLVQVRDDCGDNHYG